MTHSLQESYTYCQEVARSTAGNFYYSFRTLPPEQFRSMCALYAFMRISDDIGDDTTSPAAEKALRLERWRRDFENAVVEGNRDEPTHAVFPALADIVQRFEIPTKYFHAVLDGIESDLQPTGFETFAELEQYCYQVAGAVGVCCLHVWGFHDERAVAHAIDCGMAFQLTNILRDLGEDAAMGRTYLPREDLRRFDFTENDLACRCRDERFERLMQFEVARAKSYYEKAEGLFELLKRPGKAVFTAMMKIYGGLLSEIERRNFDVFTERVSLSKWRKLRISVGAVLRHRLLSRG